MPRKGEILNQEQVEEIVKQYGQGNFTVVSEYKGCHYPLVLRCNKCGYEFKRQLSTVRKKRATAMQCPCCGHNSGKGEPVIGENDLWTKRPDVAKLLKNPDDGYKFREHSGRKAVFKCPYCGNEQEEVIANVVGRGFFCRQCSDTRSYPNRFMGNLLKLLNVKATSEYIIPPYKYLYDFHFFHKNRQYLIEMDGAYGHGVRDTINRDVATQIEDDKRKDEIAEEHNCIMIRIDCKYKDQRFRYAYVVASIKKSLLAEMFNLDDSIFEKCESLSQESRVRTIASLWNEGVHEYISLGEELGVSKDTVRNLLQIASTAGLIQKSWKEIKEMIRPNLYRGTKEKLGHQIMCNETGEAFISIAEAAKVVGLKTHANLSAHLNGKRDYCGKLPDGTKLTWKKITKEEYNEIKNKEKEKLAS